MKPSVQKTILQIEHIEYGLFGMDFNLIMHSPDLLTTIEPPENTTITGLFPELIGYEEILSGILKGTQPALHIERIHNPFRGTGYFNLRVHAYDDHLLVILRDITPEGDLEQAITQARNELDLLAMNLIDELRQKNEDLGRAYETTLEGWAKALELRDYETKGHSHSVTETVTLLARAMGVKENKIIHYRRGALLHDIGKMGIPDNILLKNGPLTEEEWEIMRRHPSYAYEMLKSIAFLRPALDISYYHHEMWNGKGYPLSLQGEEIPLAARIFSVIDVWDALNSDRPYRKAWREDDVIDYIRANRGVQFDPNVVDEFLKLVMQQNLHK